MAKNSSELNAVLPLGMVGSTKFGIYPDISVEETINFYMSDGWLVPYPAYQLKKFIGEVSRGLFHSARANVMFAVIDDKLYIIDAALNASAVGVLQSSAGDVSITEDDAYHIAISDGINIYSYDYTANNFVIAVTPPSGEAIDFVPGYLDFQDGYVICPDIGNAQGNATWRLSQLNNPAIWKTDANSLGGFSTNADTPQAAFRFPGKGKLLWVMGKTIVEPWYNTIGAYPFPYLKSTSFNIDYGIANPATFAKGDTFAMWIAVSERFGPVIMYSDGTNIQKINADGINNKLSNAHNPYDSFGFIFSIGEHVFYQFTFADPKDNFTYVYDLATKSFFTLCDQNLDRHIAKQVVRFNNTYYFISCIDGNIYEMNANYTNYDYGNGKIYAIPRVRKPPTVRLPNTKPWIVNNVSFPIEQGQPENEGRIDLSISNDGGYTFSSVSMTEMHPVGYRRNSVNFRGLGYTNEFSSKFRFNGFGRFVVGEGVVEYYQ